MSCTTQEQREWLRRQCDFLSDGKSHAIDGILADLEDAERERDLSKAMLEHLENFVRLEGLKHDAFIDEMKVFAKLHEDLRSKLTLAISALERCSRERKARWLNDVLEKVKS